MKMTYQLATVAYCPDLTDPQAVSVPLAVVAVGRSQGKTPRWGASIVAINAKALGLDPISAALLEDVPHMLRRHIDEAVLAQKPGATTESILRSLTGALKTSVHVSQVSEARTRALPPQ